MTTAFKKTIALFLCILCFCATEGLPSQKKKSPNIVFILADDLDFDLFNNDEKLPSLLTKKGMTFAHHFAPLSLCCPSRVSTFRGQFPHNTTVFTNLPETGGGFYGMHAKELERSTIAVWLKDAGYRTALLGKYLNGYPEGAEENYIPPGWSYWLSPNKGHFQSQYNYSLNENGKTIDYGNKPEEHLNEVLTNKSVEFLNDCAKNYSESPFFLYVSSHAPHNPARPVVRYENRYQDISAPRVASFNEEDTSDKPSWVRNKLPLNEERIQKIDELYRKRKASLLGLADLVEQVINTLMLNGQLDDTYIFFSSDNGFHQGQHRLDSGKTTAYEEDIHLPLVVRGPGIIEGATLDYMTANVDYAPTFADIAGISVPEFVDGRSLFPMMLGHEPQKWRKALLLEYSGSSALTPPNPNPLFEVQDPFDIQMLSDLRSTTPAFSGLRIEHCPLSMTYVEYASGEHEFYDLNRDKFQMHNTYKDIDDNTKEKLSFWVNALKRSYGSHLRALEEREW